MINLERKKERKKRWQRILAVCVALATFHSLFWEASIIKQLGYDAIGYDASDASAFELENGPLEDPNRPFVKYWFDFDEPYTMKYMPTMRCTMEGRLPLSEEFEKILNVATYVRTNLKIIAVGDSVLVQLFETFLEALDPGVDSMESILTANQLENRTRTATKYRTLYRDAWRMHSLTTVGAPTNGGGAIALLRIVGFLMKEGRGKNPPNAPPDRQGRGGFRVQLVEEILAHKYSIPIGSNVTEDLHTIESFDAMIYRIPYGWLDLGKITKQYILKSALYAQELFGIRTIILPSLYFINNVKTIQDLEDMNEKNKMIHDVVAESWRNSSLPNIYTLDWGPWTSSLVEMNARLNGMNTTTSPEYLFPRTGCKRKHNPLYNPSIASICAETNVTPGSCKHCVKNRLTMDGMHPCMESLGGRLVGGIACLLQCSLQMDEWSGDEMQIPNQDQLLLIEQCQKRCNDQFMSLNPASTITVA